MGNSPYVAIAMKNLGCGGDGAKAPPARLTLKNYFEFPVT